MKLSHFTVIALLIVLGGATGLYASSFGRSKQVQQLIKTHQCPDCDLRGANLQGLDLRGVNLTGANLAGANLSSTKLANANLNGANLQAANLEQADLGCTALRLNLQAQDDGSNVDLNVDATSESPRPGDNTIFRLSLNADRGEARVDMNLWSCASLRGANLQNARMPDGTLYAEPAKR